MAHLNFTSLASSNSRTGHNDRPVNWTAAIATARVRFHSACQALSFAREQGVASTIAIFEARVDLAAAYLSRIEAASVRAR